MVFICDGATVDGVHLFHRLQQFPVGIRSQHVLLGIVPEDADRAFPHGIDTFLRAGRDAHQAEQDIA